MKPTSLLGPLTKREEKHVGAELFAVGDLALARAPMRVAVVGSRRPSCPTGSRSRAWSW